MDQNQSAGLSGGTGPHIVASIAAGDAAPLGTSGQFTTAGISELDAFLAKPVVQALVQDNFATFAKRWTKAYQKKPEFKHVQSARSWNWPAFLFTTFYMFYRKMYVPAAMLIGAAFVLNIITMTTDYRGAFIAINVMVGMIFNSLYFKHICKKTEEIERQFPDEASRLAAAKAAGGTSWAICLVGGFAGIIVSALPIFFLGR